MFKIGTGFMFCNLLIMSEKIIRNISYVKSRIRFFDSKGQAGGRQNKKGYDTIVAF